MAHLHVQTALGVQKVLLGAVEVGHPLLELVRWDTWIVMSYVQGNLGSQRQLDVEQLGRAQGVLGTLCFGYYADRLSA